MRGQRQERNSGRTPRERSGRSALMAGGPSVLRAALSQSPQAATAPGGDFPFGLRPNSSRRKIAAPKPSSADAPALSFLAGAGRGSPGFVPPHRGADGMSRRAEGRRKEE